MFPSQAAVTIALVKLEAYSQKYPSQDLLPIIDIFKASGALFDSYYQLFHSIRWNRSKKAVRQNTEARLGTLAMEILEQINRAGDLLNHYAYSHSLTDIAAWNEIVVATIEGKTWLTANLLPEKAKIKYSTAHLVKPIAPIIHPSEQLSLF